MHSDAVSYHYRISFLVKINVLQHVNITSVFDMTKEERNWDNYNLLTIAKIC